MHCCAGQVMGSLVDKVWLRGAAASGGHEGAGLLVGGASKVSRKSRKVEHIYFIRVKVYLDFTNYTWCQVRTKDKVIFKQYVS